MTDLTPAILPGLHKNRLPGLSLDGGYIYPAYDGLSILNIPSSLCRLLGVPPFGAGPLRPEILEPLGSGIRRVVLVLMDALAFHRLQRWMADGTAPVWGQLTRDGLISPLTSIVPSTTSTALTSLWSGGSATEHGITGFEMWLKEYGVVANMILHSPMSFRNDVGSLEQAGFDPAKFVPLPMLGPHLVANGVKVYALQHRSIVNSGLSKTLFKGVDVRAFYSAADLWVNLRHLLEKERNQRLYAWVYWSEVDHFSHFYGPDDERTAAEFSGFSRAMEKLFLSQLSPQGRRDTVLILTADHGQVATPTAGFYELRNHPNLMRYLHIAPTGENRLAFLYPRPGQVEAAQEYIRQAWPGQFDLLESTYAVESGLFGPGKPHPSLFDRLGDFIAIARQDAYLWWADKDNPLLGRHGGLHPQEMLVPFLAVRL